jgi:hypothetical protein
VIGTDIQRDSAFQNAPVRIKPTNKPLTIGINDVKLLPVAAQKTPYDEPAKTIKLTATLKGITHDGILKRNITLKNRLSSVSRASTDGLSKTGIYIADKAIKARDGIADKAIKARDGIVDAVKTKTSEEGRYGYGGKTRNKRHHPRRRITYKNNNKTHPKQSMNKSTKKATNKSMKKATNKSMKKATKKSMKKATK